jgi:hypothetical protein
MSKKHSYFVSLRESCQDVVFGDDLAGSLPDRFDLILDEGIFGIWVSWGERDDAFFSEGDARSDDVTELECFGSDQCLRPCAP